MAQRTQGKLPDHLGPLGDRGRNDDDPTIQARDISYEQEIKIQIARIDYLRSAGLPWAEAVQTLRDLVEPFADDEFWDGIPERARQRIQNGTLDPEKVKEAYQEYGWDTVTIRAVQTPEGRLEYHPTAIDLSKQYRIILRLLGRRGLLTKQLIKTRFRPFGEDPQQP